MLDSPHGPYRPASEPGLRPENEAGPSDALAAVMLYVLACSFVTLLGGLAFLLFVAISPLALLLEVAGRDKAADVVRGVTGLFAAALITWLLVGTVAILTGYVSFLS